MLTRNWITWGVCGLALVAMAGCETGGVRGPSDQEMVSNVIDGTLDALRAQNIDAMMTSYSEDFTSDQGGGKVEMQGFLQQAKDGGFLNDMTISTANTTIVVEGATARVEPIELTGAFGELTLGFDLEKRDGRWWIVRQRQY
ncbi:MAG: hypothetical protein WD873_01175 [Candidatus Hydrogenedentales bacterium]